MIIPGTAVVMRRDITALISIMHLRIPLLQTTIQVLDMVCISMATSLAYHNVPQSLQSVVYSSQMLQECNFTCMYTL